MWALSRTGRDLSRSYIRGALGAGALSIAAAIGGWTVLGVILGASYGIVLAPGIWTAYRTPDPSGISPLTWWIGLIEGVLWGYYGWFHQDLGILTFMVVAILGSSLMLIRYYATREQSATPMATS
jgi:hypothetical protein